MFKGATHSCAASVRGLNGPLCTALGQPLRSLFHLRKETSMALDMKGDEERIREGGCEAYLSKPISVGKFIETIRHFLGSS